MDLPTLPPEVLAALAPATAALHEEIRTALLIGPMVQRVDRLAGGVARNHGSGYVRGHEDAMMGVLGPALLAEMRNDRVTAARSGATYAPTLPPGAVPDAFEDDDIEDEDEHDPDYCEDNSCEECHDPSSCCGCCHRCENVHTDHRTDSRTRSVSDGYYCIDCDHECYSDEVYD